ncbi:MAG: UDP-glucuronic acid decarboxylase/UDP-4-amino-4-deoxy-L-arabinose formyltransferase [Candidatus Scalindua rubra]|uniref:phosphoribosylglycinamide formyltransferase 1 n=1 Tax=Candidatus Scalindua rubra TaxID=1872076 RepID=A0A1E3XDS3_9BACT|nr:MAG: UDP-glucuronic acid decarboxylase/UDP-4-amino-4-deoxy-L-arabinose formyltransferase [Candidatus Scalindua rubra]
MRLIIFTTRTKHHTYFIQKIYEEFDIDQIIYERRVLNVSYKIGPFFDREQDDYEELFFDKTAGGCSRQIPEILEQRSVDVYSVNQKGMREFLFAHEPGLIWVYGTGKILPHIIKVPKWGMVNLHGGISQKYRGLDSTLWAMYYGDFESLGLTVHFVSPELDTGDILQQEYLKILKSDEIYHYRYRTTLLATRVSLELLRRFKNDYTQLKASPQLPGNYYSAMPLNKKMIAYNNFEKYKGQL